MDEEYPLSKETTEKSIVLVKCAIKVGLGEPLGVMDFKSHGDCMIYMFANDDSMAIVYVSPSCYLVTHGEADHLTEGGADYLIVSNIRTFLQKLKKEKYQALTKEELEELKEALDELSDEPDDDDLEEIEDEEDEDDDN